jgi:hypothetical protein
MDVFASNSTRAASIEKEPGCDSRLSAMRTLRKAGARATKAGARELSSISQEAALLIAAAVVAVGVVVARSPVGIADLASVVKSPAARDVT